MAQTLDIINEKFRALRKASQRSIHDCANILNLSKEHYLGFEQGDQSLSLPDLEILASYLGVSLSEIIESNISVIIHRFRLQNNKRDQYRTLRDKMIRSKLILVRQEAHLSLDELSELTGIPQDRLTGYESGAFSIPFDDLQNLSEHLGKLINAFLPEVHNPSERAETIPHNAEWEPEYPEGDSKEDLMDTYPQLLAALKRVPLEDQAQIAKILLKKLRAI